MSGTTVMSRSASTKSAGGVVGPVGRLDHHRRPERPGRLGVDARLRAPPERPAQPPPPTFPGRRWGDRPRIPPPTPVRATWSDELSDVEPAGVVDTSRRHRRRPPPASRPTATETRVGPPPCRSPAPPPERRRAPCPGRRTPIARTAPPLTPWPRRATGIPAHRQRLARDRSGQGASRQHVDGVQEPRHDPFVGVDVGSRHVAIGPDERRHLVGVATGEPFELAQREVRRITAHAALAAAEGDVDHRTS